jgi:hypothetical protein
MSFVPKKPPTAISISDAAVHQCIVGDEQETMESYVVYPGIIHSDITSLNGVDNKIVILSITLSSTTLVSHPLIYIVGVKMAHCDGGKGKFVKRVTAKLRLSETFVTHMKRS